MFLREPDKILRVVQYTQSESIRLWYWRFDFTGSQFVNTHQWNWHDSSPLMSTHHAGTWFIRHLRKHSAISYKRGLKMLSNWLYSTQIEWFVSLDVDPSLFHWSWLLVVRIDSMQIKSNRQVPQRNRLSLGVWDMDGGNTGEADSTTPTCKSCSFGTDCFNHNRFWLLISSV